MHAITNTSQSERSSGWVDAGYFLETFGTDPEARVELVTLFVRVSEQQMQAMAEAMAASDWVRVSREAHALKGSLGLFGARDTIQVLDSVEEACRSKDPEQIGHFLAVLQQNMACVSAEVSGLLPA